MARLENNFSVLSRYLLFEKNLQVMISSPHGREVRRFPSEFRNVWYKIFKRISRRKLNPNLHYKNFLKTAFLKSLSL